MANLNPLDMVSDITRQKIQQVAAMWETDPAGVASVLLDQTAYGWCNERLAHRTEQAEAQERATLG